MEPVKGSCDEKWFALRITYQRELKAKEELDRLGVENFLPMRRVRERGRLGRFVWVERPAFHNYLFVRSTQAVIDRIKTFHLPWIRYVIRTVEGRREILTVPEKQMRHFIAVAGSEADGVLYLDGEAPELGLGDRVRVTGGLFEGVEGTCLRLPGHRNCRVVVRIEGVAAVATASIPVSLLERVEKKRIECNWM